ncbi:Sulfate transport system permease protein CysW [Chondromyces apiculatus DSM 436]|uniref:Sulfate transport system permease protein CysW n=1 Tax=Chondromyces apiculatus DSM 436 TaxID=1192034 RepID=A0A017SZD3_9BACT|nr:Sulfate transport system permease protein CysW [Chondromyces apiculatus DSM 436]
MALIAIAVTYVCALVAVPAAALLHGAFAEGLTRFAAVFTRPDVHSALALTALMVLVAVLVNTILGTATAWVLTRDRFRGRALLNGLVDVPFAISPVIVGLVLLELFGRKGLLTPFASALGVQIAFAWPGMALATTFVTLPFVVREVAPVLEEIGTDQESAAYTLGASPLVTFFRVTLPSIRWGLAYGISLTAARAIGEFGAVLIISGGVAGRTETATSFVYRALEDRDDLGAHAVAVALVTASVILLGAMEVLKRRRLGADRSTGADGAEV